MGAVPAISADGTVGIYELKAHLSSVLEEVVAGRQVTITRHGHPIAVLMPIDHRTGEQRRAAMRRILAAREGRTLGMPIREAIDAGRTR